MVARAYHPAELNWLLPFLEPRLAARGQRLQVIGIAGPSGVGKSTLAAKMADVLTTTGWPCCVLGMDEFFKSPEQRRPLGEWGPDHVRLEELTRVLRALCDGAAEVETMRYVRRPEARLEPWTLRLGEARLLIFEGLYTLSDLDTCGNLVGFVDHGLYLDAPSDLLKRWRFQQEAAKPKGRSVEAMERHWQLGILPDTALRVAPSRRNAQLTVMKDANHCYHVSESRPPLAEP